MNMPHWKCFVCDTFCWKQFLALMEMFVWLMAARHTKEEWRCVLMKDGAQCVITPGVLQMLKWCVDSWASP